VLGAFLLLVPSSAVGVVSHALDGHSEAYDSRTAVVEPTAAQLAATDALGASVSWNSFGTPQSLARLGGFLASGIQAENPEAAARAWLDANADLFRNATSSDLVLHAVTPLAGTQGSVVTLRQRVDGLFLAPDGLVSVALVDGGESGWQVAYVSSSLVPAEDVAGSRELTEPEALVAAAADAGTDLSVLELHAEGEQAGWTRFDAEDLEDPQFVRSVAFPTPQRGILAAYETVFYDGEDGFQSIVDAETGAVLQRESTVHNAIDNPKWLVFPAHPQLTTLNRYPWNYPSSDVRDLWCWFEDPACKLAVANPAARVQWDTDPRTNAPRFTTMGNAAHTAEGWFGGGASGYRPTSPTRDYTYPWTNQWFELECNPAAFETPQRNDIDAATVNLFAQHWKVHDWQYNLGFTERTWNAQEYNFMSPFLENDPVVGRAQSGAITPKSRDNANMNSGADGIRPVTNMFLWQPLAAAFYAPCVDGDYDANVIGHEYGHLTENRMIAKGVGPRQGFHAGAMGESFGDLNAMEYLNEYDFVPFSGASPYATGAYVTGNPNRGIRNYNMSWRMAGKFPEEADYPSTQSSSSSISGGDVNPLNFSAVGYDIVGPQVHADGEIWSATNFDIRELLLDRYNQQGHRHQFECAEGYRPPQDCPGNRRWIQLYFDAMLLMPRGPTFIDARNAILQADVVRFVGANQDLLWRAFARRGFGQHASTTNNNDTDPRGNWESPLEEEATLTFNAVAKDEGNAPVTNFRVFVGHYEARATPIERVARFVPNPSEGYDFVAQAEGYGHVRFHIDDLQPGEARTVTIRFPTNWASQAKGATATGDGTNHDRLIDDTEATNWQATGAPAEGRQVVIQFSGPRTFDLAKVSALLIPGNNRFTAVREFELYACTLGEDRANETCAAATEAGWKRILKSHKDAFPGVNVRPTAPDLVLRAFDVPRTTATHVRFVVVDNQCTGAPEYFQGEQDLDPTNPTDCRTTTADEQVRASEVQLQSSKPDVDGAKRAE
jgi:hypothetical protein